MLQENKKIDRQARKYQLTINNPIENGDWTHENIHNKLMGFKSLVYYCMSDELASTYHTHIYVCFDKPVRFSTMKNAFPSAHIENAYGTSTENREYVFKEGKWLKDAKRGTNLENTHEEYGKMPMERQGARNDLVNLYEMLQEGKTNYEILEENPKFIGQVERMDKVRQIIENERYKLVFRDLEVTYIYGDTGTGKTRGIMEKYGYDKVYRVTDYKYPFDQYASQDVIVFEEFHSSLPITSMLLYLDGYPVMLPCRYSNKVACYRKVYILSNIELDKQYIDLQRNDTKTWCAFLRRIGTVVAYEDGKVEKYKTQDYLGRFTKIPEDMLKKIPFKIQ